MRKNRWLVFIALAFYASSFIARLRAQGAHYEISFTLMLAGLSVHYAYLITNPYFRRSKWQLLLLTLILLVAWGLFLS